MTDFFTDTRSSMDACSPLDEEIAAFLDGTLSPEDRERITEHLASCESCYETFVGAVHFQEQDAPKEGVVRPFDGRRNRAPWRASRWLAVAASLFIVPALGLLAWRTFQSPYRMAVAELVEPVQAEEISKEKLFDYTRLRGDGEDGSTTRKPSFLTGAILVDLRMSLARGDSKTSSQLLDLLGSKLADVSFMDKTAEKVKEEAVRLEESPSHLAQVAEDARSLEADLDDSYLLPELLAFGKWTEAGRLAAVTESPEFFESRKNRRFITHLFKQPLWEGDESLRNVPTHLQAIQQIWEHEDLKPEDYTALANHFRSIIEAYDTPDEI